MPNRSCLLVLLALFVQAGCGAPALHPHTGDTVQERFFGPAALEADFVEDGAHVTSPRLAAPEGATRVGVLLEIREGFTALPLVLEARGRDAEGRPGPWREATFTFSEGTLRVARTDLDEVAYAVELRLPAAHRQALLALTLSAVVPPPEADRAPEADLAPEVDALASRPLLDVGAPAQAQQALLPGVRPRADWGARPTRCTSLNETKTRITLHHTVTPTGSGEFPARLRAIQAFHMDGRGWCDVGYHYYVTLDGTAWEAREARFLGTHVGGQNTNNLGITLVGCFHPTSDCDPFPPQQPPQGMIDDVASLVGRAAAHYGLPVSSSTVMGHRDNPGAETSCPGDQVHDRLDEIRQRAGDAGGPAPLPAGRVQGVVWDLSVTADPAQAASLGARLGGATVTCDCGESTTARADDGYWSFDLAPGTYTFTAAAQGYAPADREVQVSAGGELWASIGISPESTAARLVVTVVEDASSRPIENARVEATGTDPVFSDASGQVEFSLTAGAVTVRAVAEGFDGAERQHTLVAGADDVLELRLLRLTAPPPGGGGGDGDPVPVDAGPGEGAGPSYPDAGAGARGDAGSSGAGDNASDGAPGGQVPGRSGPDIEGGCACSAGDTDSSDPRLAALSTLVMWGLLRRRRGRC